MKKSLFLLDENYNFVIFEFDELAELQTEFEKRNIEIGNDAEIGNRCNNRIRCNNRKPCNNHPNIQHKRNKTPISVLGN